MQQVSVQAEKAQSPEQQCQRIQQNPITLINYPTRYINNFELSTSLAANFIRDHEYEQAILSLTKSLDMMDLGHEILKPLGPYWKLCLYGNLAMCYQRLWKIEKANKCCFKIIKEMQLFVSTQKKLQAKLNFMKKMIKVKFQHCAILSQTNLHNEALDLCKDTFQLLEKYLETILSFIKTIQRPQNTKCIDNVFFIEEVVTFAQEMIEKMLKTLKQPIQEKSERNCQFYFWARNPSKNQQQIKQLLFRKKTAEECKRSILGVNKNRMEISEFNIGSIMHIEEYHVNQFKKSPPLEEYLFKDKIYEIVIYCSMAFFTLATELRFLETMNNQITSKEGLINRKYGYEEKTDAYKLSEVYHLKAIDLVANNIPVSLPYLTHIIRSYQKHYIINKPLPVIRSIADQSQLSIATLKGEKSTEEYQNFQEYLQIESGEYQLHHFERKAQRSQSKVPENSRNEGYFEKQIKGVCKITSQKKQMGDYEIQIYYSDPKKKKNSSLGKTNAKCKKSVKKIELTHKRSLSQAKIQPEKKQQVQKMGTPQKKKVGAHTQKTKKSRRKQ